MAAQALLHELLLALLGHTGDCVQPVLEASKQPDVADGRKFSVVGLELVAELQVSPADRVAINALLTCGFQYAMILHFTQTVDEGATLASYVLPKPSELNNVATSPDEVHRLQAQQARSVFSAGSQMLSPPKLRRPPGQHYAAHEASSQALVPIKPLHPLVDEETTPTKKAVGLYLRALVLGLDEVLAGYRTLILTIEQEILRESAVDPDSALDAGFGNRRIDFGLTKLNLMLRQYLIILPALHDLVTKISTNTNSVGSVAAEQPLSPRHNTLSIHGCALVSFIHSQSLTGVPILSQVYRSLLKHLDQVLLQQCVQWMCYGLLIDPFEEFWIRKNVLPSQQQANAQQRSGRAPSSVFESLNIFELHSSSSSDASSTSSTPNCKQATFDWDLSYAIVPTLLPIAYFPTSSQQHSMLFLGKAIQVLTAGEAQRQSRLRRLDQTRHRRRGSQAAQSFVEGDWVQQGEPSTRSRASRRTASGSATLLPKKPSSGGTAEEDSLRTALAPLLAEFQTFRTSSSVYSGGAARSLVAQADKFESLTSALTALVSRRLYKHLLYDHSLLLHLDHLRRFVLLGDGTFLESFLCSVGDLFDRPATARTVKYLLSKQSSPVALALREAGLRDGAEEEDEEDGGEDREQHSSGGSVAFLRSYPLTHLAFTLDQTNTTATSAWAQLGFQYTMPSRTLELVFTREVLEKYAQIMRFHLDCRRVQQRLQDLRVDDLVPQSKVQPTKHARGASSAPTSITSAGRNNPTPSPAALQSYHLLRHRMLFFLSTLCSYVAYDVLEGCHSKLLGKLSPVTADGTPNQKVVKEFEQVRKAQEEYLNDIIEYCFLRDRVVSGALTDLFATCLQFCSLLSTSSLTASSFSRLSSDHARQSSFLFTMLSRKTDYQGGTGSFLHSLVSKLDFNGWLTAQSKDLGLNATTSKAVVPTARGMVVSSEAIQSSLQDGPRRSPAYPAAGGSTTPSIGYPSASSVVNGGASSVTDLTQQLTARAPASTFTPSATFNSQASYFASANTRPTTATRPSSGTHAASSARQPRPFTEAGPLNDETY